MRVRYRHLFMETHDEKRREMKVREGYVEPLGDDITKKIAAGEISEIVVVAEGEERTTWFVWSLVFCFVAAYPVSCSGMTPASYLVLSSALAQTLVLRAFPIYRRFRTTI